MPSEDYKSDNHHRDGSRDKAFCNFPVLLVPGICSLFKSCSSISYCLCGTGHQFRRIYPLAGDEDAADEQDDQKTKRNDAITCAHLSNRSKLGSTHSLHYFFKILYCDALLELQ